MRKIRILALVFVVIVLIVLVILFFVGYFKPKGAGVLIESTPDSTVFINGEQQGRTPYKQTRPPGEVSIRLVPDSFEEPLVPYVTKVTLVSGIETVIRREFGNTDETSAGETLSFEKTGGKETSLSVISLPDSAQINIDSTTRAFTPYKTAALRPGKHTLTISSPGYLDRFIELKTFEGYKLTAIVQLKLDENIKENEEPVEVVEEELVEEEEMVEILSTPTGFLRVRSEPSTVGEEVGRVEPGQQYVLLEIDEETGWFRIEYEPAQGSEEAKSGWISDQYAEKVNIQDDEEETETPTSTLSPTPDTSGQEEE